jgi:hypothetical protein
MTEASVQGEREYRKKLQVTLTMDLITHLPFRQVIRSREI